MLGDTGGLLHDTFQFRTPRPAVPWRCTHLSNQDLMSSLFRLKDKPVEIINLHADILEDDIREFFPLHGQLDLFFDPLQGSSKSLPFTHGGFHLVHYHFELLRWNICDIIAKLNLLNGQHVEAYHPFEAVHCSIDGRDPISPPAEAPLNVILRIQSSCSFASSSYPALGLLAYLCQALRRFGRI